MGNEAAPSPVVVAPKPSTPSTPPNGKPPGAPQSPPEPLESKPDPRLLELEKATKLQAKRAQELSAADKAFQARQKELETKAANFEKDKAEWEAWKKTREDRRRNPGKYLKEDFGEDWYQKLTAYQLNGAPPADLIASELDEREQRILQRVEEKEKLLQAKLAEIEKQEQAKERAAEDAKAIESLKAAKDKFPLLNHFEEYSAVLQERQRHFQATMKKDVSGNWLPGEVLTIEEAAAKVEARISAVGQKFTKYAEAKAAAGNDANQSSPAVSQRNEAPQRRALSTAIPASSIPAKGSERTEQERFKAALAAMGAATKASH